MSRGDGNRIPYENIETIINNSGFKLLNYINTYNPITVEDKDGYIYVLYYQNIKNGSKTSLTHTGNPYSIQNIKLWLKLNDKKFELLSNKYEKTRGKLQWKCTEENCGEYFSTSWSEIYNLNCGCPYCSGQQVGKSNCLATKNPKIASEWHPTLNGDLTPYDVVCNSRKIIWWQCNKNRKHEWNVSVNNRTKTNCPYCAGRLPSEDYNLLVCCPEIASEWCYQLNDKFPSEYTPKSGKKVWWKCKECGHKWEAKIADRNYGTGCPQCKESRGEKRIEKCLKENNIYFESQKEFDNLLGIYGRNLSYDFYIPQYNLLIEYQGRQHEKYIPGLQKSKKHFERQLEHDRRKRKYANNNEIKLLEIWYWDYDNIEEILISNNI